MNIIAFRRRASAAVAFAAAAVTLSLTGGFAAGDEFYKGKTITIIVSAGPGGGADRTARALANHWTNHIPGKPNIIVKNMPGAGHLRATNFLYSQAPKDGTTLGALNSAFVMHQIFRGKGVEYDAAKFHWIGSSDSSNGNVYVWHTTGVRTLEDATKKEVLMGGTGAGSDSVRYPAMLNNSLGTRFRVITGYKGTGEMDLAVERGEVQGIAGGTLSTLVANHTDWIKEKKINILLQVGAEPEPGFESVPMLTSFAKDRETREVFQLFSHSIALGRPYQAPPGVSAERVATLRASFDASMKDPAFVADMKKQRLKVRPTSGEKLAEFVSGMLKVDSAVLARVETMLQTKGTVTGKAKKK
ncbi:MAG TPA: tripartite tricarboxylate transporter substrate-binding protein [Alphaproteobacteria bacterium]|jgi:tripartite-type tricarboxylate transporter receptor subunit TctC